MSGDHFTLDSGPLGCRFSIEKTLVLEALGDQTGKAHLITGRVPFCEVEAPPGTAVHFAGERANSEERETLLFKVHTEGVRLDLKISLAGASLRWELTGSGSHPCRIRFPFFERLKTFSVDEAGSGPLTNQASFFREQDFILPATWRLENERSLTFIVHQPYGEPVYPVDCLWSGAGVVKVLGPEHKVIFSGELILHDGGPPAAFAHYRQSVRAQFDLSQYQREDLAWSKDLILQHFTFLYGREILNLHTGCFEVDRLLDEGERDFGGFDSLILWGTYPRMGVCERTQWDFYDDYPGGRLGLRALGERARARGARIFLPYLPWDSSAQLHGHQPENDETMLARLVKDVGADGVFLDCMAAIQGEYRSALDQAKPGVMICSEGRAKGAAFQTITGCWEQSQSRDWMQGNWTASEESMPAVDLWRFLFPEHRLFVISRFTTGDDRKRIIQRGFFNGMGWVVWQDIFGLALPFTPEEAGLLKKCRTILRDYSQVVWGANPTPLIPVLQPGVYCNEFRDETTRLWLLYNSTGQQVQGPLLPVNPRAGFRYFDVWNHQVLQPVGQGCLAVTIEPYQVGAVLEEA